jgi:hypothetical protein
VRIAIIALLVAALAGCAPKPLPDWALQRPGSAARAQLARDLARPARDRGPPPSVAPLDRPRDDLLPFTPEWQAREQAFDERLRRTMNICRGC